MIFAAVSAVFTGTAAFLCIIVRRKPAYKYNLFKRVIEISIN